MDEQFDVQISSPHEGELGQGGLQIFIFGSSLQVCSAMALLDMKCQKSGAYLKIHH